MHLSILQQSESSVSSTDLCQSVAVHFKSIAQSYTCLVDRCRQSISSIFAHVRIGNIPVRHLPRVRIGNPISSTRSLCSLGFYNLWWYVVVAIDAVCRIFGNRTSPTVQLCQSNVRLHVRRSSCIERIAIASQHSMGSSHSVVVVTVVVVIFRSILFVGWVDWNMPNDGQSDPCLGQTHRVPGSNPGESISLSSSQLGDHAQHPQRVCQRRFGTVVAPSVR